MTLGSISSINMGQSPEGTSVNDDSSGIPLIGGPNDMGDIYPVISRYTTMPTKLSASGDLILSVRATLGEINISDANYCLGRGVAGITPIHVELHCCQTPSRRLTAFLEKISTNLFLHASNTFLRSIVTPSKMPICTESSAEYVPSIWNFPSRRRKTCTSRSSGCTIQYSRTPASS